MNKITNALSRRRFLCTSAIAATIASVETESYAENEKIADGKKIDPKQILNYQPEMAYRQLGDTGVCLSVISMGGLVNNEDGAIHAYAIDHGVNLVHISTSYLGGRSIESLGKVMQSRREKVYIALKDNLFDGSDYEKGDFSKLDDVLRTLHTDHVDFLMFNRHSADSARDPSIQKSFERLKQSGKVRFSGLTSHGDVKEATGAGIRSGMYHLVNPVLNQPSLESLQEELRLAHDNNVGVMAMKTMKGQKGRGQELAFLKKLLSNPAITTVLKGIGSYEMFDQYRKAVKEQLTAQEDKRLYRYAQANRAKNCMMCDECKRHCPKGIEISTILRCKDYYLEEMNDRLTAYSTFQEIPADKRISSECGQCRKCENACPNGIDIANRLRMASQMFA